MRFCNLDYPKYLMISVCLLLFPFSFSRMVEMTWARVLTVLADLEISVDSKSVKKSLQSAVPFWDRLIVLYCMLELTYLFVYVLYLFDYFFFSCIKLPISWYASISICLIYLFWMCMLSSYSYVWYLILLLINRFFYNLIIHIFMIFTY